MYESSKLLINQEKSLLEGYMNLKGPEFFDWVLRKHPSAWLVIVAEYIRENREDFAHYVSVFGK